MGRNREDLGLTPSEKERMETWGRRAILEAKLGRREAAHQAIDQYMAEEQASDDRYLEDVNLAEVLSDQLMINMLDRTFNCPTVADTLSPLLPQALAATPNVGWARVAVVGWDLFRFAYEKCRAQGRELSILRHQTKCAHGKNGTAV